MNGLCNNVFCHTHRLQRRRPQKHPPFSNLASHARSAAVDNLGTWKDTDSSFQEMIEENWRGQLLNQQWWHFSLGGWKCCFFWDCVEKFLMYVYQKACICDWSSFMKWNPQKWWHFEMPSETRFVFGTKHPPPPKKNTMQTMFINQREKKELEKKTVVKL